MLLVNYKGILSACKEGLLGSVQPLESLGNIEIHLRKFEKVNVHRKILFSC